MSDPIKHECGIALIRLLKPAQYYKEKYGNAYYGVDRMYLMLEKQHNRGQDGAGMAAIKFGVTPGNPYMDVVRSNSSTPIKDVLAMAEDKILQGVKMGQESPFAGDLFLGHVRYGTYGKNEISNIHPFVRESNWKSRNLVLAGNFNLTNTSELYQFLVDSGQHPIRMSDTKIILEKMAKTLDHENQKLYNKFRAEGLSNIEISEKMPHALDIKAMLTKLTRDWDGGYAFAGMLGYGDAFVMRDRNGIRPLFYYKDDEILVAASERPVIQTTFNVPFTDVLELGAGEMIWIKRSGEAVVEKYIEKEAEPKPCSFERIYFSRGTDAEIYRERKNLGALLADDLLEMIDHDIENTVFSFIPNTAQVAFNGLINELEAYCDRVKEVKIKNLIKEGGCSDIELSRILAIHPRKDLVAVKDAKLRTFITQDSDRDDLVSHVYDVTYGCVKEYRDTLVVLDDSIVRGTTLRQSILRMLDRLGPKRIIVLSSAPQIRYPDCYGIDMAKLGDLIAFQAAIALLKERGKEGLIMDIYKEALRQVSLPKEEQINAVEKIYADFSDLEISNKIAELLTSSSLNAEIKVLFQRVENLHIACPKHSGDWYFTGKYPTPGGNAVANRAYINYIENRNERAY